MAVRRRRPLVPPPYPRRNRYAPESSQSPLNSVSALRRKLRPLPCSSFSNRKRFAGLRFEFGDTFFLLFTPQTLRWFVIRVREHFGDHPFAESVRGILLFRIVTHPSVEVCYNSVNFHQVFANLTISFTGRTLASTR